MYLQNEQDPKITNIAEILYLLRTRYLGSPKSVFDRESFFFRWYRFVSFYPTALFLRLGVSANKVTIFGALCLLTAFALLAQGLLLSGALMYLLAYILDFVDGNIARYVGKPSNFGKMIDGLVDSLTFLLFIALGLGNSISGQTMLDSSTEMTLGVTTAFVFLIRVYFYLRVSYILVQAKHRVRAADNTVVKLRNRSKIVQRGKEFYFGIVSAMPVLLLLAVLSKTVSLFLFGYCIMFTCATLFEVVYGLRRVWLSDAMAVG